MKLATFFLVALTLTGSAANAQTVKRLQMNFDHLESRAEEVVDVTLDGQMLKLAGGFLSNNDPEEREIRGLVGGLTGIYVKSFTFKQPGSYSASDVDSVRRQIGSGWEKIVNIRSKSAENVEIYLAPAANGRASGVVIIAADSHELTVVQLLGQIDMNKLSDLDGQFGIPDLDVQVNVKK